MPDYIMTGYIIRTPTTAVGTTAATGFPATWAFDYTHPYRPWRATDCVATTTGLYLDYGAAYDFSYVIIDNVNVTSVFVDTGNVGAPITWDTRATVTVSKNMISQRYKAFVPLGATYNCRYIRVRTNMDAPTTNGEAGMQIGGMLAGATSTSWAVNPGFPAGRISMRATLPGNDFIAGGREPIQVGNPYAQITLTFPAVPVANIAPLQYLASLYTKAQPMWYYRNNGDTSDVYICRRIGDINIEQTAPNVYRAQSVVLEECV